MLLIDLLQSIGFTNILLFILLIIIGIIIIIVLKAVVNFILPIIAALVIWFLFDGNLIYTGLAFVVVALLQLALKKR